MTYKLSQDHLESFFGVLRARGGNNNNPSAFEIRKTIAKLFRTKIYIPFSGNTNPQDATILLSNDVFTPIKTNECFNDDFVKIDLSIIKLSPYIKCTSAYIAGYIIRKLIINK